MEKEAQKDYETMMEESSAKRAADSKSLTQKEGSKALGGDPGGCFKGGSHFTAVPCNVCSTNKNKITINTCNVRRSSFSKPPLGSSWKASTEGELEAEQDKKKATVMDLMATEKYIGTLHGECDWILSNYDARKAPRVRSPGGTRTCLSNMYMRNLLGWLGTGLSQIYVYIYIYIYSIYIYIYIYQLTFKS